MKKYRNRKITVNGIKFDSMKEARRYKDLLLLEAAGEISQLQLQVPFELLPSQRAFYEDAKGKRKSKVIERGVKYVADFVYFDKNGKKVVEDTKGFRTKDYVLKRKMMLYFHGVQIKEV